MDLEYYKKRIKYRESIGGKPDLKVYYDKKQGGYLTAGWGHKLTEAEKEYLKEGDTVSMEQVNKWFEADIARSLAITKTDPWIKDLPVGYQFVLHDMAYNMGAAKMKGTVPKGFKRFFKNVRNYSMAETDKDKDYYSKRAYMELRHKNPYGIDGDVDMRGTKYFDDTKGRAVENARYILNPSMELIDFSMYD